MNNVKLDRYARDFRLWRDSATINYSAAVTLFETENPFLLFPAVTLGHYALEMYLKSALILNGMTVFDPRNVECLDPRTGVKTEDCVWGHGLVQLADKLAQRSSSFFPAKHMNPDGYAILGVPMTIRNGLEIFDPFFTELRYPRELEKVAGVGTEHGYLLNSLASELTAVLASTAPSLAATR